MSTYKELTMREAYDLHEAGVNVERAWGDKTDSETGDGWRSLLQWYEGDRGNWDMFKECYSQMEGISFRVEVE